MAENQKTQKKSKNIILIIILVLVVGVACGGGVYLLTQKASKPKEVKVAYYDIGEYLLNLNGEPNKSRYLKTSINISYDSNNKKLIAELEESKPAIRAAGLEFLQSCSAQDFSSDKLQATKKRFVKAIDEKLKTGRIIDILFQDLIVQ